METRTTGDAPKPSWPELLGSHNWEGLLDPLNLNLRRLLLRCGDLCQVTYDAFNNDANSKYAGSSRYGKASLFQKVMFEFANDYMVTSFLYATARVHVTQAIFVQSLSRESWDRESNWIGYIAATTDEVSRALGRREIYIVWRGTQRSFEWINVLDTWQQSARPLLRRESLEEQGIADLSSNDGDDERVPRVMNGWLTIYISNDPKSSFTNLSARDQILNKVAALREQYKSENLTITVTGHSLGASLATLSAFDLVENLVRDIPVTAIVFGSPQVGNKAFRDRVLRYPNLKILHVRNKVDMITLYPGDLLGYRDVGTDLVIDNRKAPSLKRSLNTGDWHNLQAMLHTVAGWNGPEGEFELKVKRSLALVNKSSAALKDEYLIPESWWIEKNRGMVLNEDGEWVLASPTADHVPVPEEV